MELSIVINCSDDLHVFETIKSIEEDVEIICSITPNKAIEERLLALKIPYVITPKGSQSVTTNAGINLVTNNKFILMDSDCYFEKGFIDEIFELLNKYDVVNGNIVFDSDNNILSKAISKCKKHDDTHDDLIHKPGLGIKKSILNDIGNYWFDEQMKWSEDSELSFRITNSDLKVCWKTTHSIHHLPTSYSHNLKSCFSYGTGDYYRFAILKQYYNNENFVNYELKRYKKLLKQFNFFEFVIMLTNDIAYHIGYLIGFFKYRKD
ncbi:MAG: hypothetical protein H6559_16380 [Lewinellaceae bacterium]|nr:hypothetical protein [candidate division KSB1 bacterium]MCB9294676.1 hypothetical protein [Lewinellaceae bacterium]